jgi:hypothetical protein
VGGVGGLDVDEEEEVIADWSDQAAAVAAASSHQL